MEVNLPSQNQSSTVYIPALQIDLFKDDITTVFGEERGAFSGRWTTHLSSRQFYSRRGGFGPPKTRARFRRRRRNEQNYNRRAGRGRSTGQPRTPPHDHRRSTSG